MMMHGIYKDNLRSQVVNERGFLDNLHSGQCQGHTCRLTICGTPLKAVVDESVSNYRALDGCFKVLLVFKVPFYKGHHPVELFCSSQLFDPLITLEFNTFHLLYFRCPYFSSIIAIISEGTNENFLREIHQHNLLKLCEFVC